MSCIEERGSRPRVPHSPAPTRRSVLGGLLAGALAACDRYDAMSWVTRERFDVDRRFTESVEELTPPLGPGIRRGAPWSMLVISDLHSWDEVPVTLEEVREHLDRQPVDLVFCLGDLADAGYPSEHDAAATGLSSLGAPVLCAFGNHDAYHEGWASFRDRFGPSVYELRVAGSVVLVTDSAGATLGGLQRPWLEERLADAADAEHVFVLSHYPLWTGRMPMADMMASQQEVYDILDLLRRHRADAYISGHTHRWGHTEVEGLQLFTVSSLREEAADRTALRVDVDGGEVAYTRVDLG